MANARPWPTAVSPLTTSAKASPSAGARPSNSFSIPRWTNQSRAFIRMIVSPTTENLKWPGSIIPACTGPTGISYTPVPSTGRKENPPLSEANLAWAAASWRIGCQSVGQWSCSTSRRGRG